MKTIQLAVTLLIVCIGCAEALRCNRCVPARPGGSCTTSVEECGWGEDVCISAFISTPRTYSHFRRCSKRGDAMIMDVNPHITVRMCETDLCN
ncbi:weak neurotoxin WNTX33-like [Cheilinus undulatus]|uniref:weak neurotoxin WNTX33-like n=1 Tax=Cheilinus undulatus TaxID=241271 RepID=UPI001BD390D5|nr:weak neurotoxin WNTX33-like [Cheilinus undulatus]